MKQRNIIISRVLTALAGAAFLCIGIFSGEYREVFEKAVRVCLECIGIG